MENKNLKTPEYIFDKYARQYQDKYMDVEKYAEGLELLCKKLTPKNPEVLDIACGPANISQFIINKRPDIRIEGIDVSENMIELAKINVPSGEFYPMDCRNLSSLKKKYQAIICGFCLPYLDKNEAFKLFEDAKAILNSEGILYVSTINGEYSSSAPRGPSTGEEESIQMFYYQFEDLSVLLKNVGFDIIYQKEIITDQDIELIVLAKKGID